MKLSKPRTFGVVVIMSFLVASSIFIYLGNPTQKPPHYLNGHFSTACETYFGNERDVCLSEMAIENEEAEACQRIHNSLIKDICYRDISLAKQRWPVLVDDDSCYFISDSVLQYLCLRTYFRPHILGFQLQRPLHAPVEWNGTAPECEDYDSYHHRFCIHQKATRLTHFDLQAAMSLCNRFEDLNINGECMFHIATTLSLHLNTSATTGLDTIKKFCEGISHPSWKSECYYLLADELALHSPTVHFNEITSLCKESNRAVNYACISHVAQLMTPPEGVAFCFMQNESYQLNCFMHVGVRTGRTFTKDIPEGTAICTNLPNSFKGICMSAFAFGIGEETRGDVSLKLEKCQEIPEEAREFCVLGIITAISEQYFNDLAAGEKVCSKLSTLSSECVEAIVWMAGVRATGNLSEGIDQCNRFSPPLSEICFSGLSLSVAGRLPSEAPHRMAACFEFPEQFRGECFNIFGWEIWEDYIYNQSQGATLCVENAGIYAQECVKGLGRHLAANAIEDRNIKWCVKMCIEFPENMREACFTGMAQEILSTPLYPMDPCDTFPEEYLFVCQNKPVD